MNRVCDCGKTIAKKFKFGGVVTKTHTRKTCVECKPIVRIRSINNSIERRCNKCQQTKLVSDYGKATYCKPCTIIVNRGYDRSTKKKLVSYKGGECQHCGYNKCMRSLDFHHVDPTQKEFAMRDTGSRSLDKMKEELDKCILLCKNCHGEEHERLDNIKITMEDVGEKSLAEVFAGAFED